MEDEWVIKINDELMHVEDLTSVEAEHWRKRSIYRVPVCVTDMNKKAYKPQVVSFGPYHNGEDHLKEMEVHKHRALLHFLKRSGKPLTCYIDSLQQVAQELKDSYDLLDPAWQNDTNGFLRLMILDGCFMLEILRTAADDRLLIDQSQHAQPHDYAPNDPIFSNHGKLHLMPYLKRDMLMLQNQLPMLLLDKLLAIENQEAKSDRLLLDCIQPYDEECINKLILDFCNPHTRAKRLGKCLHILDVYRKSLLWEDPMLLKTRPRKAPKISHQSGGDEIIRSAMELNEAGIRFKKSKTGSLKDISFHGGILKLPLIVVDDATESMFLNLIAFERLHVGAGNEVTSYIFFMDNIIDNVKDVSLLHSCGIIQNAIGSDNAVAKLFNSLSKDITLDPDSSLDLVHKLVSDYCKYPWNEWRANLIHTYFRSPWAILSVVAAIFLFALTIVSTVYGVYSYYYPHS
ncbi:PREDICTED: UPF0481 protein At3g47200-like [Nicotiana attenuata]|uniref:Upf0481 protein n=1 Tax=Nicotiana attenuata TaxID=49451 RepID=A0A314KJ30_NICAT|nr:PREDICTED: UPF0481 protein At3g47200-like [Nicotiana attenuata]OIT29208.1 upf0481 protein [Nicotiana attenuata]